MSKKTLVVWDVETTGLDPKNDYIIQLSAVKLDGDLKLIDKRDYVICPQHKFIIAENATKVHGYTEEFIKKNGVTIKSIAQDFIDFIGESDYVTYNGNTFDIKFIVKDFALAGFEFPIEGKRFYDAFAMECRFNPRNLSAVYERYTGEKLEGAHNSFNDVLATAQVLRKQLETHNLTLDDVKDWNENNMLSPDGSIRNAAGPGENMKIVFAVGKYKDSEIYKVMKEDPSYCKWWAENVASKYTLKVVREYCKKKKAEEDKKSKKSVKKSKK